VPKPTHPYLTQLVHTASRVRPSDELLIFGDRSTTAGDFRETVARFAGGLRSLGVGPADRVAFLSLNSDRLVMGFFACFWMGAVANPLNVRWTVPELTYALNDCGASVLVVDDPFTNVVDDLVASVTTLRTVVYLGDRKPPNGASTYSDLVGSSPVTDAMRSGDDAAFILYTGGTTGFPKGVQISHANLWSASMGMLAVGNGPGSRYLNNAPLFHIGGLQMLFGHLLNAQGPHVILPAFDPAAVLATIETQRITDVFLVPTMLQMVLAHPSRQRTDVSSLQTIYYGAAPMTEGLLLEALATFDGVGFIQGYGMTETGVTVMLGREFHTPAGLDRKKLNSVGRPLPGTELAIRDIDDKELPPGVVGEIVVRGVTVTTGYVGKPEQTSEAIRDGWLHSGDAGYLDDDGFLFLVDRLKDMIITGGENVYSIEVERVLSLHPDIAACAVIGVAHPKWGEQVHAVVVRNAGVTISETDVIEHCKAQLAGYKCPRSVEFRDTLPLSAAGKVLKNELRVSPP
jgi:acyl-CoA synthetase (AMP-forming)/AMP-acid ligase II